MYNYSPSQYAQRARAKHVPISSDQTLGHITKLLKRYHPTYCVELWSAVWWWSYHIASTISNRWWTLISFECSYPSYHSAIQFLKEQQIHNSIVYFGNCLQINPNILLKQPIDFLYIDAQKSSYFDFYLHFASLLTQEATLVFDDVQRFAKKIWPIEQQMQALWRNCTFLATDYNTDWLLICRR